MTFVMFLAAQVFVLWIAYDCGYDSGWLDGFDRRASHKGETEA